MTIQRLLATLVLLVFAMPGGTQSHAGKNNELVEFAHVGAWEIWCIRLETTRRVECNLNYVLRYRDHPDFRAMIPRVFWRDNRLEMHWTVEGQTSLARGSLTVGDNPPLAFDDCGRPCVRTGAWLDRLRTLSRTHEEGRLRFHDYVVQAFDESLPLAGLREGIPLLIELQRKHDGR